jgi:hypothetical protein
MQEEVFHLKTFEDADWGLLTQLADLAVRAEVSVDDAANPQLFVGFLGKARNVCNSADNLCGASSLDEAVDLHRTADSKEAFSLSSLSVPFDVDESAPVQREGWGTHSRRQR